MRTSAWNHYPKPPSPEPPLHFVPAKLKPIKCNLNFSDLTVGSTILTHGDTAVVASVNRPEDMRLMKQRMDPSPIQVKYLSQVGRHHHIHPYKEEFLKHTCVNAILRDLLPPSGVYVTVQEIEDAGGLIACTLNAVCIALLSAGVPLKYTFASISTAISDEGDFILDPSMDELETADCIMTFIFGSDKQKLICMIMEGKFDSQRHRESTERARVASHVLFQFYKEIIDQYAKRVDEHLGR